MQMPIAQDACPASTEILLEALLEEPVIEGVHLFRSSHPCIEQEILVITSSLSKIETCLVADTPNLSCEAYVGESFTDLVSTVGDFTCIDELRASSDTAWELFNKTIFMSMDADEVDFGAPENTWSESLFEQLYLPYVCKCIVENEDEQEQELLVLTRARSSDTLGTIIRWVAYLFPPSTTSRTSSRRS